jgi:hypothetical protein
MVNTIMKKESTSGDTGKVPDPILAQEMAEAEAPHHKNILGVLRPSERKIAKGEKAAEERRLQGVEITKSVLPQEVLKIVEKYNSDYTEACKTGRWDLGHIFRIDPLVGETVTAYRIEGEVSLHDDYGHWVRTDNGTLVIKTDGKKVIEVDRENFMTRCIRAPS